MSLPSRIALYTFGIFIKPSADPVNAGFHARNDANLAAAERAAGFIARSGYDGDPGPLSWGAHCYPRFYTQHSDAHSPSTLSHGRDWFLQPIKPPAKPAWPPYVLWWVAADEQPDWRAAVTRLEHLHDHGPSAFAFSWATPFDAAGQPTAIDRNRVRDLASANRSTQGM